MNSPGEDLLARFEETGDPELLRAAVIALENEAADSLLLAEALRILGEQTEDVAVLDRAAGIARHLRDAAATSSNARAEAGQALSSALWAKADLTGEPAVLQETADALHALYDDAVDDPQRARHLANAGLALRDLFNLTGDQATLTEAIRVLRDAETAVDDDDRPAVSMNLALALQDWAEQTGHADALDEAIDRMTGMLATMPEQDPDRPQWASNLSAMYQDRFEATSDQSALREAVTCGEMAVSGTARDDYALPGRLTHLGLALRMTYEATGDLNSLADAVRHSRDAVDLTGPEHPKYPIYASNLASALRFDYERTGTPETLDEAISYAEQAEQLTPEHHHRYAGYASNLSLALWTRYERSGHLGSLHHAVAAARRAVEHTDDDQPDANRYRTNLGLTLWTLSTREPDSGALDESIIVLSHVLDRTPDGHAERARFAGNVANAYWTRYERGHHRRDLDAALRAADLAHDLTPNGHVDRGTRLGNLGVMLLDRYRHDHEAPDLARAVELLRAAVELPGAKDFDRALHRHNLAEALAVTAVTGDEITEAIAYAQQAADDERAPVRLRVEAARTAAELQSRRSDPAAVAEALSRAVELLPQLAAASLDRADQEDALLLARGLGPQAAAWALKAGNPPQACRLLERARGVLLRASIDPDAAARTLRRHAPELADLLTVQPGPALQRIQGRPDLAALFTAPDTALGAGVDGPVVVVNVEELRSDALILTGNDITAVPLPHLDADTVRTRAAGIRRAVQALQEAGSSAYRVVEARANKLVGDTITWLADAVTGPVLQRLAERGPLPQRLWWSPTGALTALPLHAAVPAGTISSYAPTLQLLTAAVTRHRPERQALILAPADDLPELDREITAVTRHHPHADVLTAAQATVERARQALPEAATTHICAHGVTDPDRPSRSGLELADDDLTVEDISRLPLARTWLTYLSACSTAQGSDLLPEESLTVAAAFAVAGSQHVIAALWPVSDREAADVADAFHTTLARRLAPAHALDDAVQQLRTAHPDRPAIWAPFVHLGP
ncbi:MAG: CHAT domain-containing protein [Actinomycetota bacterium]|nr:CHAT domain-containing protein [Actinomycetota bacterium]